MDKTSSFPGLLSTVKITVAHGEKRANELYNAANICLRNRKNGSIKKLGEPNSETSEPTKILIRRLTTKC
jgi:hypothetical protein